MRDLFPMPPGWKSDLCTEGVQPDQSQRTTQTTAKQTITTPKFSIIRAQSELDGLALHLIELCAQESGCSVVA
jgi:hypothetical protein